MAHMHTQIRAAFASLLGALATTGSNVFPDHVYAIPDAISLPAIALYALEEEIELDAAGNTPIYRRTLEFAVEGLAQATSAGPSATLAQIAAEVEAAVGADPTLGGLVIATILTDINYFYSGDEVAKPTGAIRLTFAVEYRTTVLDPETSV